MSGLTRALLALLLCGCGESVVDPPDELPELVVKGSVIETVPPAGGTVEIPLPEREDGSTALFAEVVIPQGALAQPTEISAEVVTSTTLPASEIVHGDALYLRPEGLEFLLPVTVRFHVPEFVDTEAVTLMSMPELAVSFGQDWWEVLGNVQRQASERVVSGETLHFSVFAVTDRPVRVVIADVTFDDTPVTFGGTTIVQQDAEQQLLVSPDLRVRVGFGVPTGGHPGASRMDVALTLTNVNSLRRVRATMAGLALDIDSGVRVTPAPRVDLVDSAFPAEIAEVTLQNTSAIEVAGASVTVDLGIVRDEIAQELAGADVPQSMLSLGERYRWELTFTGRVEVELAGVEGTVIGARGSFLVGQ